MIQEAHKQCFKCGESKNLSAFYNRSNKCKDCTKEAVRLNRLSNIEYYNEYDRKLGFSGSERIKAATSKSKLKYENDPEFKAKVDKTKAEWAIRNKVKRLAQQKVSNSLRDGKLIRSTTCSSCGKTDCEIQGHHWSYLEEHWLDVIWLCTECHGKEHRKINAENRQKLLQSKPSTT